MRKTVLLILFFCMGTLVLLPQTASSVQDMRSRLKQMEENLSQSQSLLASNQKDIESLMNGLAILSAHVAQRELYIDSLALVVNQLKKQISLLDSQLKRDEAALEKAKNGYAETLKNITGSFTFEERLMFVFSTKSFNEMYNRARYMRKLSDLLRKKGEDIKEQIAAIADEKSRMVELKGEKDEFLQKQKEQQKLILAQEQQKKKMLKQLQKNEAKVKREIELQRKEAKSLEKEIDNLIAQEQEAKKKAQNKGKTKNNSTDVSKTATAEMEKLSGSFKENKGKLPAPVVGTYVVVKRDTKGSGYDKNDLFLGGGKGLQVRAIFKGKVKAKMSKISGGGEILLVEHGSYFVIYSNVTSVKVKKDDEVEAGTILGSVKVDGGGQAVLTFNIYQRTTTKKKSQKLNPLEWIKL